MTDRGADPGHGSPRPRPGPLRWLLYAFWVPLPERYRRWVLHDATCSTWVLRHIARTLVAVAVPVTLVAVFLPANGGIRALTAFVAGACAALFVTMYINEATDHRLLQAGYPWGTGERVRAERAEVDEFNARVRRWERQQRRRGR
ncbi:hypothetical protein SAMN05443575_2066 [Jatrophihabitans endophyticus]|uniref:DUF5313 domain-containing protein n=1 Tax=Jatrophihabitans endophyticus TaxID=1206085 RepID=A0A1M5K729_9ACTN|nr:DUF5313 family protein [Jatrophihabitans endophyticus]SHG48309.1 hypothetical protein SAMN05443575_2066 [Jatrophihabitans endophyticus]